MPSTPKIPRETILETAYSLLIQGGASEVTIKSIAAQLGCSTQPISWQFGNMDNFRAELLEYCIDRVSSHFYFQDGNAEAILDHIVSGYIDLALDTPNLYHYLYMGDLDGTKMGTLARSLHGSSLERLQQLVADHCGVSLAAAARCTRDLELYVHGIASYIATGFIVMPKDEIMDMTRAAYHAFVVREQQTAALS